jgi:lauroyl/myristoyl acyltransferase
MIMERIETNMLRKIRAFVKQSLKTFMQGLFIFCLYPLISLLPHRWGYKFTRLQGKLNFRIMHQLRECMLKELAECLPERTEEERQEIARRAFQVQAAFFYDSYSILKYRIKTWTKKFMKTEGAEHLEASLERGKGAILCSMHFNHFFLPLAILGKRFPTTAYGVWPGDLRKVNFFVKLHHCLLIWGGQRKAGIQFLAAGRHPKGALEGVLHENRVLFILFDIPLPEMRDLRPVKLFGQEVMFPWGLIMVKYLTQAAFHVGYMVRDPMDWEKQTLVITPELTFSGKLAADQQVVVTELEKAIRQYPEFWWGWGLILHMRPEFVREARRRGDYTTSILAKKK